MSCYVGISIWRHTTSILWDVPSKMLSEQRRHANAQVHIHAVLQILRCPPVVLKAEVELTPWRLPLYNPSHQTHPLFFALGCFSKALPFHMQYCSLGITVVSSCWLPGILPLLGLTKKRSSLLPPNCWWCQPLKSLVVDGHQAKSLVGKAAQPLVSLNITKNIIQENQHLSTYHPVSSPWKISTSHWGSTSHFYGFYIRKPHFDTTSQEKHLHDSWVRMVRSLQCGAP